MRTTTKWISALGVAVATGCAVAGVALRHGYHEEKDRIDLIDLTGGWSRPIEELRVPDEPPAEDGAGEVSASGMILSLAGPDPIEYAVLTADGAFHRTDCRATLVVVCTDLGDGYTLLEQRDTGNSDPATTVRRWVGDLMFEARVPGARPELAPRLRRIITETHIPDDAELLRLLRSDGYRTDWL